ncbi:MAG: hypothetical protein QXO87_03270 [Desulfurococcaceae archaeon]
MSAIELSLAKLIEAIRRNEVDKLREELSRVERISMIVYKLPWFELKVRAPDKRLVMLNQGILNRLEYALLKTTVEAAKNGRLPVFKDIANAAGDYKASAKYLVMLADMGYVVFPDPAKAAKLREAVKAVSESRYRRCILKALDLPVVLNINVLESSAVKVDCTFRSGKLSCNFYSHNEERERAKLQVNIFNEYI